MLRDLGLLVLRLTVGGLFMAHGYPKLFGGPGKPVPAVAARYLGPGFVRAHEHGGVAAFANVVEQLGFPEPMTLAWVASAVEFIGGALLVLGWLTRVAALLLAGDMAVATYTRRQGGLIGESGYQFPLTLLAACLTLAGTGPGQISLDADDDQEAGEDPA